MRCRHCGFTNGEDDHRCLRCGRRLAGPVISAPPGYAGANALALNPTLSTLDTQDFATLDFPAAPGGQAALFNSAPIAPPAPPAQKVIPFDSIPRQATTRTAGAPSPQQAPAAAQTTRPSAAAHQRKTVGPQIEQGLFDFIPAAPVHRELHSTAPAQVDCEQPVARPRHRMMAGSLDAMFIAFAFGIFLGAVRLTGGSMGEGKQGLIAAGSCLTLISLMYSLLWVWAGTETAGMRMAGLHLITFEGHALDRSQRITRFAATMVSFCSLGVGLIWALADEEHLTWHDHISKTFPTPLEIPQSTLSRTR